MKNGKRLRTCFRRESCAKQTWTSIMGWDRPILRKLLYVRDNRRSLRRHTCLLRSRHILLCMCLHVCMYSCCAGDLSLPVVRLVDSFHLVVANIFREQGGRSLIPIASCAVLWIRARPFLSLCMSVCVVDLIFSSVFSTVGWTNSTDKGSRERAIGLGGEASAGRSKYWSNR